VRLRSAVSKRRRWQLLLADRAKRVACQTIEAAKRAEHEQGFPKLDACGFLRARLDSRTASIVREIAGAADVGLAEVLDDVIRRSFDRTIARFIDDRADEWSGRAHRRFPAIDDQVRCRDSIVMCCGNDHTNPDSSCGGQADAFIRPTPSDVSCAARVCHLSDHASRSTIVERNCGTVGASG
jgi:hypothetical protein